MPVHAFVIVIKVVAIQVENVSQALISQEQLSLRVVLFTLFYTHASQLIHLTSDVFGERSIRAGRRARVSRRVVRRLKA